MLLNQALHTLDFCLHRTALDLGESLGFAKLSEEY